MAENTIRTVLEIGGDGKYKQSMNQINSVLKSVDSEMAALNAQYGKNDTSVTALMGRQTQLTARLDAQKKKLELIGAEYEKVSKNQGETSEAARKLQREYNYTSAQITRTTQALDELNEQMEQGDSRMQRIRGQLQELGVTAESFSAKMEACGEKFTEVGLKMAEEILNKSVKGWMELSDAMADVDTIADTDAKSLKELTNEVMAVSDATGVAATEIARAQYQAIDANIATADSALVVENAAKAAKVGVMELGTTLSSATNILDIWKISAADSEKVFTALLTAQKRGKTTVEELSDGIGDIAGLVPQVNMSLNETLAVVSTLTQRGIKTENVFAMLQEVMENVITPSEDAAELAKELGLQFDATALKTKGFAGFLADVAAKTKGNTESLVTLFGSLESASQIMLLAGDSAGLYADILDDVTNSAGSLDSMFNQRMSSSTEKFSAALNKVNNAAIRLGESLSPYIDTAADMAEGLANAISSMDVAQGKNIITTALWLAGIGKTLSLTGKMAGNITNITTSFKALGTLMSPTGWVVGGIAAMTGGILALFNLLENNRPDFSMTADEIASLATDIGDIDVTAGVNISGEILGLKPKFIQILNDGVPESKEIEDGMKSNVDEAVGTVLGLISTAYTTKKTELDGLFANGVIDQTTYDTAMTELETQATAMETDLKTKADAVTTYVSQLCAQNRAMTTEEIETLNSLLASLAETVALVEESTNVEMQVNKLAYDKTLAGYADESERERAAQYVDEMEQRRLSKIDAEKDALDRAYAITTAGMNAEEAAVQYEKHNQELERLEEEKAQVISDIAEMRKALLPSYLKAAGISQEELIEYNTLQNEYRKLFGSRSAYDGFNRATVRKNAPMKIDEWYEALDKMNALEQKITDSGILENPQVNKILADSVGQGILSESMLGEWNGKIKGLGTLSANEFALGLGEGLTDAENAKAVQDAGEQLGAAVETGTKAGLEINSPSKVAIRLAQSYADTLADTLLSNVPRLQAVGNALAAAVTSSRWSEINFPDVGGQIAHVQKVARAATSTSTVKSESTTTHKPQTVVAGATTTIVNNINYTAGAGTRREARRLNQMLAWEQKAALVAEGL